MKATIEIPDELCRRVKAKSALLGKPVREVTAELYRRWLDEQSDNREAPTAEAWLQGWLEQADGAIAGAPAGPTARAVLGEDRGRWGSG